MYVGVKNLKKNIEDGVHLVLGQAGEKWVNYLEQYSDEVEQLMKLTRNKRRFYQQGMRAATLIRSISIASLSPPQVGRLTEPQRSQHRHSSFWIGLYGQSWAPRSGGSWNGVLSRYYCRINED
jgi:hypothetical protein